MDENLLSNGRGDYTGAPTNHPTYDGLKGDALRAAKKVLAKTYLFDVTFDSLEAMQHRAVESVSRLLATPCRAGALPKPDDPTKRIKISVFWNADKDRTEHNIEGVTKGPSLEALTDAAIAISSDDAIADAYKRMQAVMKEKGLI